MEKLNCIITTILENSQYEVLGFEVKKNEYIAGSRISLTTTNDVFLWFNNQ